MSYCPHCSEPLPKPVKICPYCKRSIDLSLFSSLYQPGESSVTSRKIRRKIWFREKLMIILPIISVLIGFTVGVILTYGFSVAQFAATEQDYENQIEVLRTEINNRDRNSASSKLEQSQVLADKDRIIASLAEQTQIYSRMMTFTSRLARECTITPNSPQDIDFFQRNVRYLQSLFNQEQDKLKETTFTVPANYSLSPIPQFLE